MGVLRDSGFRLLIVDDEHPVRALLSTFLDSRGFSTAQASTAEEALSQLAEHQFEIVLADVQMPGMDGLTLLSQIRRCYPETAVLMLTACEDVSLAVAAMKSGALDYLTKPFDLERVDAAVHSALERQRAIQTETRRRADLEQTILRQTAELHGLLERLDEAGQGALDALVAALDAREHETHAHSQRVAEYSLHLAAEMGLSRTDREIVRQGALLHDIGKIGISDNILLKPGPLDPEEWRAMRRHPQIGYAILNGIGHLRPAAQIVLSHHERFDGAGYPCGLKGEQIPLGARIFAVADSLDAITSDRPYHSRRSIEQARHEILRNSETQFDPAVVHCFLRVPPHTWTVLRRRSLTERSRMFSDLPQLVLE